jgi:hypothetical protein
VASREVRLVARSRQGLTPSKDVGLSEYIGCRPTAAPVATRTRRPVFPVAEPASEPIISALHLS